MLAKSRLDVLLLVIAITVNANVLHIAAQPACTGAGRVEPELPAQVAIVSPAEGKSLLMPDGTTGSIEIEARGIFAKVALYVDGSFISTTPWTGTAGGRAKLALSLPGGAGACDGWHFVEVALMDADDWRLENSEAEAVVRFTHGCSGALAAEAAALQQAAAERREQERAGAFEQIYESFGWEPSADGSKETRSGPGSYLARTNASRAFLSDVLHKFNVTTMLDVGCGDVNWQGHTPGLDHVDYLGVDIVPQMIADNERRLGGPGRRMRFAVKDAVKDELGGPYDLVLCRDTLFHLPLWDAVQVVAHAHTYTHAPSTQKYTRTHNYTH